MSSSELSKRTSAVDLRTRAVMIACLVITVLVLAGLVQMGGTPPQTAGRTGVWSYSIGAVLDTHYRVNAPETLADWSWRDKLEFSRIEQQQSYVLIRFPILEGVREHDIVSATLTLHMRECVGSFIPKVMLFEGSQVNQDWNTKELERGIFPEIDHQRTAIAEYYPDDGDSDIEFLSVINIVKSWYSDQSRNFGIALQLSPLHSEGLCYADSSETSFPPQLNIGIIHPLTITLLTPYVER